MVVAATAADEGSSSITPADPLLPAPPGAPQPTPNNTRANITTDISFRPSHITTSSGNTTSAVRASTSVPNARANGATSEVVDVDAIIKDAVLRSPPQSPANALPEKNKSAPVGDTPDMDMVVVDSDSDAPIMRRPLRRSTRNRTRPKDFFPMSDNQTSGSSISLPSRSKPRRRARPGGGGGIAGPSNANNNTTTATADESDDEENRLDQIALEDGGTLRMRVHPCAVSLMQLHVHLSKTEVIGYLGGFIMDTGIICVLEAFPAHCVEPKEMTKSGRSAYREVEMKPESDVMLRQQIDSKGLAVVGWYHSHPDKKFTVEPSRVDIENQHNYQQWIFKGTPFVAAILAPYNEDLPDAIGAMDCFYVRSEDEVPLRVPYDIEYANLHTLPANNSNNNSESTIDLASYKRHLDGRLMADDALETQATQLIMDGAKYRQRVHLLSEWRDGARYLDKMIECLSKLLPDSIPEGITSGDSDKDSRELETRTNNQRLQHLFAQFRNLTEDVWPESPQKKTAAAKKRKRKNNR